MSTLISANSCVKSQAIKMFYPIWPYINISGTIYSCLLLAYYLNFSTDSCPLATK